VVGREEEEVVRVRRGECCVAARRAEVVILKAQRNRDGYRKGIMVSTTISARDGAIVKAEKGRTMELIVLSAWMEIY